MQPSVESYGRRLHKGRKIKVSLTDELLVERRKEKGTGGTQTGGKRVKGP